MPSPLLIETHRAELSDITTLAIADLTAEWQSLPLGDAPATKRLAEGLALELVDYYGTMSAGAGADWYEEAREAARMRGTFTARPVVRVNPAQVAGAVGWAAGPLFGDADPAKSLARLSGSLQRFVVNADRATILDNTRRDVDVRWYRSASANACAFCALSAGRGAVYRSQATAAFKAHDNCRCIPAPLFPTEGGDPTEQQREFSAEYGAARDAVLAEGDEPTTKAILAKMRALTGRA